MSLSILCDKAASTVAYKLCRQWDVHKVLPIDGIFLVFQQKGAFAWI